MSRRKVEFEYRMGILICCYIKILEGMDRVFKFNLFGFDVGILVIELSYFLYIFLFLRFCK